MEIKWPAHCFRCQYYDNPYKQGGLCTYCLKTGKSRIVEQLGKGVQKTNTDEQTEARTQRLLRDCKHYLDKKEIDAKEERRIIINTQNAINCRKSFEEEKKKSDERMKLYRQGLNDRQIGNALGIDKTTVRYWRNKRGLPPNCKRGATNV